MARGRLEEVVVVQSEVRGEVVVWQQAGMVSRHRKGLEDSLPCSAAKGGRDVSKGRPWLKIDETEVDVVAHPWRECWIEVE
jgi:hypothetical protein